MDNYRMVPALILIIIGVALLLGLNIFRIFWPLLLILAGIAILSNRSGQPSPGKNETSSENKINEEIIFTGINKKIETNNFQGGKLTTIFGGGELDLRNAKMNPDQTAELEVTAIFGGVKILVPKDWSVSSSVTGIFGGFNNQTAFPGNPSGRLLIKGAAIFGGGEVSN